MRGSFILGILACVFGIIAAVLAIVVGSFTQTLETSGAAVGSITPNDLYADGAIAIVGAIMAIAGGVIGRRKGGVVMVVGGVLMFIGTFVFGILPFILALVGGILAFREKAQAVRDVSITSTVPPITGAAAASSSSTPLLAQGSDSKYCQFCGSMMPKIALFCPSCGRQQV